MLQGDAIPIDSPGYRPAPAEFFEVLIAARSLPIRIEYGAIRSLRSALADQGQSVGLLLGTRSPEAFSVDGCELLPPEAASTDGFVEACSEHPAPRVVGFFRTQAAGWPEMQKSDREIVQRCFRHPGALFLLIQTPARRPWSATLFDLDADATAPAKRPSLEFFFDEYLLRNGYSTGLVPAPEQEEPLDAPPKSKKTAWIAAGILGALIPLGTLSYLWLAEKNRGESAALPASSPLALKVARNGNDFEISWDRLAPALQQASGGSLTIRDGDIARTLTLSPNQLREGRILYAPLFGDLNFRLEIQQGVHTQAESVQVLSWDRTAAELGPTVSPTGAAPSAVRPVVPAGSAAPIPSATPKSSAALPPAVTAADSGFAAPALLKRASPNITPEVKRALELRGGPVKMSVRVTVDTNGKVLNAQVVAPDGNATLADTLIRSAALDAARLSTFSPAKLNGKAVVGDLTIEFDFQ